MSFLSQIKQLGKESLIYGFGGALRQSLMVLIAPFLTYIFLPEEYGILTLVQSLFAFILMFTSINIGSGVFFHYFDKKESQVAQRSILSTGYVFFIIMAVVMSILAWISAPVLNSLLSIRVDNIVNVDFIPYIRILAVGIFFSVMVDYFQLILRILRKPFHYITVILFQVVVQLLSILILVFYLKIGLSGMFIANILSAMLASILAYVLVKDFFDLSFSKHFFRLICSYALPQFPSVIIQVILTQSNRFFLNAYVPLVQLGLYSIAEKYSNLLFIGIQSFILAWGPYALSIMKESFSKDLYRMVFNIYTVFFGMAYIGVSFLAKPIFNFFLSENYLMGYQVVYIIALGLFFTGVNNIVGLGIGLSKKKQNISRTFKRLF